MGTHDNIFKKTYFSCLTSRDLKNIDLIIPIFKLVSYIINIRHLCLFGCNQLTNEIYLVVNGVIILALLNYAKVLILSNIYSVK